MTRSARIMVLTVGVFAVVCAAGTAAMIGRAPVVPGVADAATLPQALAAVVIVAAAGPLVWRRPHLPLGWLLLSTGFFLGLTPMADTYAAYAAVTRDGDLRGAGFALWAGVRLGAMVIVGLPFLLLLFPDGRLPSRRWRPLAWLTGAAVGAVALVSALTPGHILVGGPELPGQLAQLQMPVHLAPATEAAIWRDVLPVLTLVSALVAVPALASLGIRLRRAGGQQRAQLALFGVSAIAAVVLAGVGDLVPGAPGRYLWAAATALPAVAIAVSVERQRLFDLDPVLNRGVVYALLTAALTLGFVAATSVFGYLVPEGAPLGEITVAMAAVAVVATPLRGWLQRRVDRFFYGDAAEPYQALTRLGARLEQRTDDDNELTTLAETVAVGLRLPFAAVEVGRPGDQPCVVGEHGARTASTLTIPLSYRGDPVGRLVVSPHRPHEDLSGREQRLLTELARPVGAAAHAWALTMDLQQSRERIVVSREEERRRLRRDLHDGLGPSLATVLLKVDTAHSLLPAGEPPAVDRILGELHQDVRSTISDVRRLVDDLRPPALDELGLVEALRQQARRFEGGTMPAVGFRALGSFDGLPAAVEVAAYRIVSEALTNVAKHAQATQCDVHLTATTTLQIEVIDDGVGIAPQARTGVGLPSMRERALELGGSCELQRREGVGTVLRAALPIQRPRR